MNPSIPVAAAPGQPSNRAAIRAVIADDERLLREQLQARLRESWPDLDICGVARDGLEAVKLADELRPDVVFLDIRMPGLTGIEAAREIAGLDDWHGEFVFVTAYDEYAVTAFEQGAVDYLLKPVETARLDKTVARLRARLAERDGTGRGADAQTTARQALFQAPVANSAYVASTQDALLQTLAQLQIRLNAEKAAPLLRWLQCSVGTTTKLICVDDVLFFRSDEKYTRVVMPEGELLIRKPMKELTEEIDPQQFWQIHRSVIVNLQQVTHYAHSNGDSGEVQLKGRSETLSVSRSYVHLFRQM